MTAVEVEVSVLGPVRLIGCPRPFERSAALELVVYLAFHRDGVTHGEWPVAIWPERAISSATVYSTASDARRGLGLGADGMPHLPRGTRLRLRDSVTTDVERFSELSSSSDPSAALEAFDLIRGPAFAGLSRGDWAIFEGVLPAVEALVVQRALRTVDAFLRSNMAAEAERVIRLALRACPYDERLYRGLLLATEAQGDRARLRTTMAQLAKLAGADRRGSITGLHPRTTALYRQLLVRGPCIGVPAARL